VALEGKDVGVGVSTPVDNGFTGTVALEGKRLSIWYKTSRNAAG